MRVKEFRSLQSFVAQHDEENARRISHRFSHLGGCAFEVNASSLTVARLIVTPREATHSAQNEDLDSLLSFPPQETPSCSFNDFGSETHGLS